MSRNAIRTLRISLAALVVLFSFAEFGFAARTKTVQSTKSTHTSPAYHKTSSSSHAKTSSTKSVKPVEPMTYGRSKSDGLAVKSKDKLVASLPKNAGFVVLCKEAGKFNVKLADGRTGWVDASKVTLEETRKPLPVSDTWSFKSDIVRMAYAYRGARYVRGGSSASGFDCSGFVKYLYATKGIKLPHDSRALYACGTPVAKADLQPGDILFFAGTYRAGISHVGLYVGDGKFIHASTHRTGVRLDYLAADYYVRHYAGAKRIK